MKPAARRGGILTLVGYAASQLIRLAGNLILWRLLHPEAFGLMAIVNVFLQGLHMFSDVGIGPSIIQNKRGDEPDYLNTAWTIQVARGFLLFTVAALAAGPVAGFYGRPELASLIPAVAFGSILAGFNSTRLMTSTRHIALGRLTIIDLSSQVLGLTAMVVCAYLYRTIWALVLGSTVSALVRLTLSHTLLPGITNRFRWDRSSATVLIKFGRWIFLSTLLAFIVEQSDRLIFGKLIPMSLLGVYSIALMWASFPAQIITNVFNSVLFPLLSRVHNAGANIPAAFRSAAIPWLMLAGWLSACLVSGGPALIRFLYDERALEAGSLMQILGLWTWFSVLASGNATTLFARGVPKWVVLGSAAKLVGMIVFIPLGMRAWDFPGAVAGFAGSELLIYGVMVTAATRLGLKDFRTDVVLTLWVVGTTLAGLAGGAIAQHWVSGFSPRAAAFIEGVFVFVAVSSGWGTLLWNHRRAQRRVPVAAPS